MRKKYVPDLVHMGALYEGNYSRLMRLIRMMGDLDSMDFDLHNGHGYIGRVNLILLENCKYTDTFLLEQTAAAGKWVNNPKLRVRLYHDALVAEVVGKYGRQAVDGVNHYPNQKMHLPDEKNQLNLFLAEWLNFCISYGYCEESPFSANDL
tara:strand:- start:28809 stop:29261 length:453 start_codon:yes stop_codon:yes gene_type:complete